MEKIDIQHKNVSFPIEDESHIGKARRRLHDWLKLYDFSEEFFSDLNIIITELGTNLVKYAPKQGELIFRLLKEKECLGLEIISVDDGKGIESIKKVIKDGVSTGKSRGVGLGAVKRLSDSFEIFSAENHGTIVHCKKFERKPPQIDEDFGYICLPLRGNLYGGDAVVISEKKKQRKICVIDGLGHGEKAALAARVASEVFWEHREKPIQEILKLQNEQLRPTRGAAISLIELDYDNKQLKHQGIGNISSRVVTGGKTRWLLSNPGIVGLLKNYKEPMVLDFNPGDFLLMNSDGIKTFSADEALKGMYNYSSTLLSAYLYKQYNRLNDDSIIVVYKL